MSDLGQSNPREINDAGRPTMREMLANKRGRWMMGSASLGVAALLSAGIGYSVSRATSPSTTAGAVATGNSTPASGASNAPSGASSGGTSNAPSGLRAGGGSNARSGPAAGGTSGTITSVSTSSFTVTTSARLQVNITEASSTTYKKGTTSSSADAVAKGQPVLVLGTTNGPTIAATQVIVAPTNSGTPSATKVVPFQRGAPTTSKQVGQVPANWSQGSGTIVSGTAANKATEAALAAYPGGVVNRVVKVSGGEYNVHILGVNWPHHIFVSADFKVVGAL